MPQNPRKTDWVESTRFIDIYNAPHKNQQKYLHLVRSENLSLLAWNALLAGVLETNEGRENTKLQRLLDNINFFVCSIHVDQLVSFALLPLVRLTRLSDHQTFAALDQSGMHFL
jgi:hypothetical protein